ncbi:MAG: hypothetical protein IJ025_03510 [Clostridia bacterium]|nr:hypothetical protein [Clostridia bacterium]
MSRKIKVITAAIVVTVLIWLGAMPFGAIEIIRCYGDIDNDAYVTTMDARIALMVSAGIYETGLYGLDYEAADIDGDGNVTTVDARLILRTAAGQIEKKYMEGYEFDTQPEEFTELINDYRFEQDRKSIRLTMSPELCEAAELAAQEYATKTGSALVREDGSYYFKLLEEMGIECTLADKMITSASFGYAQAADKLFDDAQSQKAIMNKDFRKIGVGAYSTDGRTFYWCVIVTD